MQRNPGKRTELELALIRLTLPATVQTPLAAMPAAAPAPRPMQPRPVVAAVQQAEASTQSPAPQPTPTPAQTIQEQIQPVSQWADILEAYRSVNPAVSGSLAESDAYIRGGTLLIVAKNPFFFHWYPFFVFLLGTGCRIGEAIGIRWDDVDMKKRTININHSLTYYTRSDNSFKCEFRVSEPKTEAGIRTIPMMGPVYEVLKSEYQRQQEEGFCVAEVDGMTNFIFTNRFGNPHNPQAVNRAIKRIVDTHNAEEEVEAKKKKREPIMLPRFSCHIFRHTFASRFCENETNVKVIQEVMGHADVSTTMNIYAEANPEVTREALEKLAKNMDVF